MRHVLFVALALIAAPALAGDAPAPRAEAQAGAKSALGETKLDDGTMTAVYGDLENFAAAWARHVKKVGPEAARAEDLREVADEGVRDKLQARGIALHQQEAIVDAMALRAKAILADYENFINGQSKVKRALEDSGLEEPALSELFARLLDFGDDAYVWVKAANVGAVEREPAAAIVAREAGPMLEEAELSEKSAKAVTAALTQWLEGRAAFEAELHR